MINWIRSFGDPHRDRMSSSDEIILVNDVCGLLFKSETFHYVLFLDIIGLFKKST